MAVTRTSAGALFSSAAAGTVAFGVGATAGDLGILIVETANQLNSTPTGFTVLKTGGFGTAGAAGATAIQVLYKPSITAGDISGGVSLNDSGDHQNAVLLTFNGHDTTTPVLETFQHGDASTTATSVGLSDVGDSSTTITASDVALAIICTDRDSNVASTNASAAWANIAGSNSFIENLSSATGAGGGIIVNQLTPSGTQTAGVTFSCTITASAYFGAIVVVKAAASGTIVAPVKGHLSFTGYQPAITLSTVITPSVGHLIFGGKVPTVTRTLALSPSTGHLTVGGKVPTITVGALVNPLVGHLTFTGYVPTITRTTAITPSTGHLSFGGKVPTVVRNVNLTPSTGHLSFTGKAPSLTTTINPSTGHLVFTGYVPDVSGVSASSPSQPLKVTYRHRGRNC